MSADSEASNKRKASSPPRENTGAEDGESAANGGGGGLKKVKTLNGAAAAGALTIVEEKSQSQALVVGSSGLPAGIQRTSNLTAPTIELTGHGAAVFACKFNPSGSHVASGSYDKNIFLWQVFDDVKNVAVLTGHKSAVTDLCWSRDGDFLYSASADKMAYVFDVDRGVRVKTLKEHSSYVNSISVSRRGDPFIVTGSDDGNVMVWDQRVKAPVKVLTNEQYQVTAVAFADDANQVFSGGIDNDISVWDWRKDKIIYTLSGHTDTITGLSVSPDGSYLLSNGMDAALRQWDVRPFATSRLVKAFVGARHDLQKNLLRCSWSPDGKRVSAGSADRLVYIWDVASTRVLYRLPGHNGSVTEVDFHPNEPIIVSAGLDKKLFLGEVDPTIA